MVRKNSIDLKELTRRVTRAEIRRLQDIARTHFYAHDVKSIILGTKSIKEFYKTIAHQHKLSDIQREALSKGLTRAMYIELIASLGKNNVQQTTTKEKTFFRIVLENADYNNIARKRRKDNLITQQKVQVKVSVQMDRDLRDAIRDYCNTNSITMSSIVREQFKKVLEKDYYDIG
ncbi:hypothetical protein [Virgibacillus halophilus]|uniref:hypothetical protein n=1 Tax=Tigheibacillus halophilus TaxID=361280 RepID=UPI0036F27B50